VAVIPQEPIIPFCLPWSQSRFGFTEKWQLFLVQLYQEQFWNCILQHRRSCWVCHWHGSWRSFEMLVFVVDLTRMHQIQPDSSCSSAIVGTKYLRRHADLILRTPIACPIRIRSVCRYNVATVAPWLNGLWCRPDLVVGLRGSSTGDAAWAESRACLGNDEIIGNHFWRTFFKYCII
jgi:hypothetical protein